MADDEIVSVCYFPTDVPYRKPGYPDHEEPPVGRPFERVAKSANGYTRCRSVSPDQPDPDTAEAIDAAALARGFAEAQAGAAAYCDEARAWRVWDGTLWRDDRASTVPAALRERLHAALAGAAPPPDGGARLLRQAEAFARGLPELAAAGWDEDTMLLGTPGGTVELATGALREADPGARITRATAVTPAAEADCPLWRRFVDEAMGGDSAQVGFLRRFLGYALTGETREHALVFGHGDGGNGKTVLANTVRGILGDYAVAAAPDLLVHRNGPLAARGHSAELAMLRGARLVTASETEAGQPLAEARLKLVTGGDPITARFANRDFFTYTPRFKLFVIGNHVPVLRSIDAAIGRRLCLVPFAPRPARPDRELEAKLKAEWPAILRWMIDGCREWQAHGLGKPEPVLAATAAHLEGQDTLGHFLHEACAMEEGHIETAGALYAAWVAWAKAAGEAPGSRRGLGLLLERRGMRRARSPHARLYRGLRLLTAAERAVDPRDDAYDA